MFISFSPLDSQITNRVPRTGFLEDGPDSVSELLPSEVLSLYQIPPLCRLSPVGTAQSTEGAPRSCHHTTVQQNHLPSSTLSSVWMSRPVVSRCASIRKMAKETRLKNVLESTTPLTPILHSSAL